MENKIFVEVEGVDYSGKTTLMGHLVNRLGIVDHYFTREPYKGEYRNLLLNAPLKRDEALEIFVKDRIEHVKRMNTLPHKYIWCDRYLLSTLVYQTGTEKEIVEIMEMHKEENLPLPDVLVYLFCSKEVARQRASERPETNHYDEHHRENAKRYRKVLSSDSTPYYKTIPVLEFDTSVHGPEAIAKHVWDSVKKKIVFANE